MAESVGHPHKSETLLQEIGESPTVFIERTVDEILEDLADGELHMGLGALGAKLGRMGLANSRVRMMTLEGKANVTALRT